MVKLDLRRTRDGAIVVLHDQTLERLWVTVGDSTPASIVESGPTVTSSSITTPPR